MNFDPNRYGESVARILGDGTRLADLGPGQPQSIYFSLLSALKTEGQLSPACQSGLWLYHDHLDQSHTLSQDLPNSDGSFWHAIMHRREPDAWNSKYWWARVGRHPVLQQLRELAPQVGYEYTSPEDFVDFCEQVRDSGSADEETAKRVQLLEWQLLFDHCYQQSLR